MNRFMHYLLAVVALVLAGCASEVRVTEIPPTAKPGDAIEGVPFRVLRRFDAVIYEKTATGYQRIGVAPVTVPDPNHLYAVNFNAHFFANPTFTLKLNPNSTLKEVKLKGKSTGSDALKELGTQFDAVATAKKERDKTDATELGASSDLQIALAQAKADAAIADAEYSLIVAKPDVSRVDILKAEQKKRDAELKANKAALLAGQARPVPNTLP